eukprot:5289682-Amphidinium_carterae.1
MTRLFWTGVFHWVSTQFVRTPDRHWRPKSACAESAHSGNLQACCCNSTAVLLSSFGAFALEATNAAVPKVVKDALWTVPTCMFCIYPARTFLSKLLGVFSPPSWFSTLGDRHELQLLHHHLFLRGCHAIASRTTLNHWGQLSDNPPEGE